MAEDASIEGGGGGGGVPSSDPVPAPAAEEGRDDFETVAALDSEFRTQVGGGGEDLEMTLDGDAGDDGDAAGDGNADEEDDNEEEDNFENNDLNATRIADDDDSKLDIHSVLSGNNDGMGEDDDDDGGLDAGPFGKNLVAIFDDAKEMDRHLKNPASAAGTPASNAPVASKMIASGSSHPSRPPLAPPRAAVTVSNLMALKPNEGSGKPPAIPQEVAKGEDKRLSVFLRVRPPVAGNGGKAKAGDEEGSLNTIDVIGGNSIAESFALPTTIRTYPPLNSNAAKVVRGGRSALATSSSSQAALKNALGSKSLTDDTSEDSIDPSDEVRGVKEYSYSGVFGPNSTQEEVYDNLAAPFVEGLFPKAHGEELGESALLFTLGVTNAGKTHTVMGTGFETKASDKKKSKTQDKKSDIDPTPNDQWGIIPRALDDMFTRVNSLNEQATMASGASAPQLQVYMSYLEIYNEQIYDLLPNDKAPGAPKRRVFEGPPTLKLRESKRGRIFVRGLARHAVSDVRHGLELAQTSKGNRHTASNNINAESSRSHSICQLEIAHAPAAAGGQAAGAGGRKKKKSSVLDSSDYVDSEYETDDDSVCSRSSTGSNNRRSFRRSQQKQQPSRKKSTIIWIVDLAGSERSKRTRSHTRHQKEAALINASLMNLMRCLREMLNHQPAKKQGGSKQGGGVVPFRDSKLTHMFMNHLTGPAASRTCMIVNVNPAADDYDETQHVLSYAATARNVTISAVDYNKKRREFAKGSKSGIVKKKAMRMGKPSPMKKKRTLVGSLAKKLSPRKRNRTAESSSSAKHPRVKRLRSNSPALGARKPAPRPGTVGALPGSARKPLPGKSFTRSTKPRVPKGGREELEHLREENFDLKATVDDLRRQLADSEAEVRSEVVEMMGEQLEERKASYENRIEQLQEQLAALRSSKQELFDQQNEAEKAELLNECEEEMKRMRDEHLAEMEEMSATHLQLVKEHEEVSEKLAKKHREEVGVLRHRSRELQAGHDGLLVKYNTLLAAQQQQLKIDAVRLEEAASAADCEKENPAAVAAVLDMQSPNSMRKLPRQRVSDVAVASAEKGDVDVVVVSPKKKTRGQWLGMKSPGAKVGVGTSPKKEESSPMKTSPVKPSPSTRSPLGDVNKV